MRKEARGQRANRFKITGLVVVGVLIMVTAMGCGAGDESGSQEPTAVTDSGPDVDTDRGTSPDLPVEPVVYNGGLASLVKGYTTFDQLWEDSVFSVSGVAASAEIEIDTVDRSPTTITEFLVEASSDPSIVGTSIYIRQTGSADLPPYGLPDILIEGQEYLLFAHPFRWEPDIPLVPEQYVITGQQAAWLITGDKASPIFPDTDDPDEIRQILSPDQIEQILAER